MCVTSSTLVGVAEVGVAHRLVAADLRGRAAGDHAAEVDHHDAVAGRHHEADVVLDEEHAHVALVGEPPDEAGELGALVLVEPGGGLVQHHHRRPGRHRSGDADEPAPAVRAAPRASRRGAARARTRAPRRRRSDGRSWRPGQKRSVTHDSREARWSLPARMFSSTLMSSNSSSDWNERRSPSRARCVAFNRSMRRSSSEIDPPADRHEAGHRVDERRLPRAVRPDQADDLARADLHRHVVDRDHRAEADGQARRSTASRRRPARPRPAAAARARSRRATRWSFSHSRRSCGDDVGDAVLVDDEDHEEDERTDDEVPLVLEADPVLDDAGAEAADRVRRAEDRAEHVAETADDRVPEAVDRREDVELGVGDDLAAGSRRGCRRRRRGRPRRRTRRA